MENIEQDLRYGVRMLFRSPVFTIVIVLTLAIGIGLNTTIFSIVDGILFRPLPYEKPEQLFTLVGTDPTGMSYGTIFEQDFLNLRQFHRGLEGLVAAEPAQLGALRMKEGAEDVRLEAVSAGFLQLLRIRPACGRTFVSSEHETGRDSVAMLTHGCWQRRFGGDSEILGKTLRFEKSTVEIIGVLPESFVFPYIVNAPPEVLVPLVLPERANAKARVMLPIGRLKANVSGPQAQEEVNRIVQSLMEQYPEIPRDRSIRVSNLQSSLFSHLRLGLFLLFGAAGFVLLTACANVASLLMARGFTREHELAIRSAVGATRSRLVRQLLVESLLLSVLGGALGLLLSYWVFDLVLAQFPLRQYTLLPLGIDGRVLIFSVSIGVLTGLLFGILPALQLSQPELRQGLQRKRRDTTFGGLFRLGNLVVSAEVALALMLLAGSGLMVRGFVRVQTVHLGFEPENVLTVYINLPITRYPEPLQRYRFQQDLINRMRRVPGVSAVAAGSLPMVGTSFDKSLTVENESGMKHVGVFLVTSDYFQTLGIPLLQGRVFSEIESRQNTRVAIANESAARLLQADGKVVGKRLQSIKEGTYEVIGVVADSRQSLRRAAQAAVYMPMTPEKFRGVSLAVRSAGGLGQLVTPLQAEIRALDANVTFGINPLDFYLDREVATQRFQTLLFSVFAVLALAMTVIGIYGILSYSVSKRTQEIGIMMALGARAGDIQLRVAREALTLIALGTAIGLVGALALTRLMGSLLYEITPHDPGTFVGVLSLMIVVALLASYIPARKATRIDPIVALRRE